MNTEIIDKRIYSHWEQKAAAKSIARALRKHRVNCRVINGNGSTSPPNSDGGNYFIIEPVNKQNRQYKRDTLYLNFEMTQQNADNIKKALGFSNIPFSWNGELSECFIFNTGDFIK